jgi:hypothetical protein
LKPQKKPNRANAFLLLIIVFAVLACNTIAGIEPGRLGLCADGSQSDTTNCDDAGAGGFGSAENSASSSGSGTNMPCDTPWQRTDPMTGQCYLRELFPRGWALAEQRCVELGGHLVAINSAYELGHLADWIALDTWIGGTDATTEGEFVWTNGQPWSFASWKDGLPLDGNGNRDCVMLATPNGSLPVFTCRPCTEKHAYICESPPNNP